MSTAKPDELFHGLQPRDCGEHRTCGGRAWCFDCTEWCSPALPCTRCELPAIRAELERLRAEVAAARASQPAQSPSGPGDGHGAAPGNQGSPAARTEPRAMRPEDVPDEIRAIAAEVASRYRATTRRVLQTDRDEQRAILAAVIPAIGEHLATAIEANPMNECSGAVAECARLVRNLTQGEGR